MNKMQIFAVVLMAAVGGWAIADTVTADQGAPGTQGAWRVDNAACKSPTHSVTSVTTGAGSTPSSQLAGRRFITMCNSIENTAGQKVKCRIDGTNPVMGSSNVGDVIGIGDCVTYWVGSSVTPKCIADATAAVTGLECK